MWVSYVSDTCCILTRNMVEGEIDLSRIVITISSFKQKKNIYICEN